MIQITPVILCGVSGSRLWPLSCTSSPKQFVPLIGNKSLLRLTAEYLARVSSDGPLLCVAVENQCFLLANDLKAAGLANIAQGLENCLHVGNFDSLRDWGHAKVNERMQWMLLQQQEPEVFVIATGQQFNVRQFIQWSAAERGISLCFEGQGVDESGIVAAIECDKAPTLRVGQTVVRIDQLYVRPTGVETLLCDPSKARDRLGWKPRSRRNRCVVKWSRAICSWHKISPCCTAMGSMPR